MPKIYLYAEILTHIRQLTLHASLITQKREGTKLDVTTDKKVISVTHDGETQRLYLPTQIKGDATVTFPLLKTTDISARVQIEDEHEWQLMINHEIEAPWMAADLNAEAAIQCRHCQSNILSAGNVTQWKTLPNENWAELMDFWFCHKPHHDGPEEAQDAAIAKGFSSTSKLAVVSGTGMTDLISIVLHAEDCRNIKAAETRRQPDLTVLRCGKCLEMLGTTSEDERLVRLLKSSIAISSPTVPGKSELYPSSTFTCAQILSLIEATALKKFVVHSADSSDSTADGEQPSLEPLILWVFNPDIYYSCSAYEGNSTLSNAAASEIEVQHNPNNDDTSTIYGDHSTILNGSHAQGIPNEHTDHRNPNRDNISQIYDESSGPRFVEGDIEIEVPLRNASQETSDKAGDADESIPSTRNAIGSEIPIESIAEHETPFISSKPILTSDEPNMQAPQIQSTSRNAALQTSSQANEHINLVHRAAKIFYKPLPTGTSPTSFLDVPTNASTHEDLYLEKSADFVSLRQALEKSTTMLPASVRSFQDWKVGLLDRYEKVPSGLGVMQENPLARGVKAKDGRVTRWDIGHGAHGLYE